MKRFSFYLVFSFVFILGSTLFAQQSKYGPGTNEEFRGPVGLQLYSIRHLFQPNLNRGMEQTRSWGFKYVEVTTSVRKALPPEELLPLFDKYGLKGPIAHWSFDEWAKDPEAIAKYAKAMKLEYAGTAWIPFNGNFTEAECRKAIEVFNKAGDVLAKYGIKFIFHNHGQEFVPWKDGTLFDMIIQGTNPKTVFFELDILWCVLPGENPVRLFKKYPNRFAACHLKDHKGKNNSVPLGTGEVDWPTILQEAQKIGIKYYFIEDESKQPVEQISQTLKYLEKIQFPKTK